MKKYMCRILGILFASSFLCGCNADIPDLTEEQSAMITEYATNLLVKHSELSNRSLLSETELVLGEQEEAEAKVRKVKADEIAESYLNKKVEMIEGAEETAGNSESDGTDEEIYASSQTVSEFFEENDFSIDYMTYDLCTSYPEEAGEDFFMAMDATAGHQLCVVKFQVQNMSSSDQELDMLGKKGRFTLRMGDGENVQAQSTMLLNDLAAYRGTLAAGVSEEMVLVFEVDDNIESIDSMKLIMKDENGENVISLE